MKNNNLYNLANQENIPIVDSYIEDCNGAFIRSGEIKFIVLNQKNISNSKQENCVLAEELGHYYMDATYNIDCEDVNFINKQEYKAKKWAYTTLIPFNQLKLLIDEYQDLYEVADKLDVTYDFLVDTIKYYKTKRLELF